MNVRAAPLPAPPPSAGMGEDALWEAVEARDARCDGAFVFAVTSTGVYCRPSCPARRPRRDRVRFFSAPGEAEAAGFRACRRCAPRSDRPRPVEAAVERARAYLADARDEPVTLAALARAVGVSPSHLHRAFTRLVGLTPKAYQDALRMERFRSEVRGGRTISRATYEAGFGSSRGLYEKAGPALGMSPGTYRRGGRGTAVRWATADTRFGHLLVAATARGICRVMLGDTRGELTAALEAEYPGASLTEDAGALGGWLEAIVEHVEGSRPALDLPVDVTGSEFQRRIWRALRDIPYGETRTYAQVAAAAGRPGAARAVGRACATNPVALLVPCHRVVRDDGSPGGYRWGAERKARLLEQEGRLRPRSGEAAAVR